MWFNLIKIKKNPLLESITHKDLKKKLFLLDEKKITTMFEAFVFLKKLAINNDFKYNIINLVNYYISVRKIFLKTNVKNFKTVLQLKNTKKQLFCTIFNKKKTLMFVSNGFFLKKFSLKKHQKKDSKVSILALKKVIEFFKKKNTLNLVINIMYSKNFLTKYLGFLKSNLKNKNILYFYSPKFHFSKKKFKKVQSIKRKLKKKYVFAV